MKKILVLTYSFKQFNTFLYEERVEEADREKYVYGDRPEKIMGTDIERIIVYGTFWDRPDAIDIYELAKSRVRT